MKNRIPSYRLHKSSGLAVVTFHGRDYYLGKHGSPESIGEYRRLTGLYVAGGMTLPANKPTITVNELLVRYWDHAQSYYRKAGRPTSQTRLIRVVCRRMRDLFGTTEVVDFGPSSLLTLRESWIRDGNARIVVNRKVQITKRLIDWGVTEGLVSGSVSHTVRSIRGLTRGRTTAAEREPVRIVDQAVIEATMRFLRPRTAALVRLQLLTGMRPGEVCSIRPRDIDRSGLIWTYTPASHKTEHHGRNRMVAIGPMAQSILGPWLDGAPTDQYLFSNSGRRPILVSSYRRSIVQACLAARVPSWTPHRLRHNFATEVRRRYGLDGAQVMLGHAHAEVTQVYAERDLSRMAEIAAALG